MSSRPQHYTETFKLKVVEDVSRGLISKRKANLLYGIKGKSLISNWQRNYQQYGRCCLALSSSETILGSRINKTYPQSLTSGELQAKIDQLEKQLEDEQLRSEAYQRIIDIAEKEFNIPIRKKLNTK